MALYYLIISFHTDPKRNGQKIYWKHANFCRMKVCSVCSLAANMFLSFQGRETHPGGWCKRREQAEHGVTRRATAGRNLLFINSCARRTSWRCSHPSSTRPPNAAYLVVTFGCLATTTSVLHFSLAIRTFNCRTHTHSHTTALSLQSLSCSLSPCELCVSQPLWCQHAYLCHVQ